ncbi:MAG: PHB depolymerase family esterase, partial [Anaerolineales bacterium]
MMNINKVLISTLLVFLVTSCIRQENSLDQIELPPGWTESSLQFEGFTRWYRVYIPDPLPENPALVLYLHGGTQSMRAIFSRYAGETQRWFSLAEDESFILLVPNGVNAETGDTYGDDQNWNDLRPDNAADQTRVDDAGFLKTLVDRVSEAYKVDPDRVFVSGASNGGMMTYRLLIEIPERFSAGAAFIANLPAPLDNLSHPVQPTPLMIVNGTLDPLILWEGGTIGKDRGEVVSAGETVRWWVSENLADPEQLVKSVLPDFNKDDNCRIEIDYYPAGNQGAPVLFYSVIGGGHTIPSIDEPGLDNILTRRILGPVCRDADGVSL